MNTLKALTSAERAAFDICECGHPRSEHTGMNGHGDCQVDGQSIDPCDCTQFTWSHFAEASSLQHRYSYEHPASIRHLTSAHVDLCTKVQDALIEAHARADGIDSDVAAELATLWPLICWAVKGVHPAGFETLSELLIDRQRLHEAWTAAGQAVLEAVAVEAI